MHAPSRPAGHSKRPHKTLLDQNLIVIFNLDWKWPGTSPDILREDVPCDLLSGSAGFNFFRNRCESGGRIFKLQFYGAPN